MSRTGCQVLPGHVIHVLADEPVVESVVILTLVPKHPLPALVVSVVIVVVVGKQEVTDMSMSLVLAVAVELDH